jgi:hypothetical protein
MPVTAGGDYPVGVYAPDISQGRGERRGLPIDAGRGRGRELEESLGYKIEIFKYYYFYLL